MLNIMTGVGSHAGTHPCAYCISASKPWDSDAPRRTLNLSARQLGIWQKTSGKKTTWRNVFSCSKQPIFDSTKPILILCSPSPLHLKLGLVNLLMDLLSDCFPVVEGLLAAEFGIPRKEHHGGSFEWRQCSRNVDFFESCMRQLEFEQDPTDERTNESSHLSSAQLGTRPSADPIVHCLRCLHEVDKGIFGPTLNPRHAVIIANFQRSFKEVMEILRVNETPKAHILIVHVLHCLHGSPTRIYQRTSGASTTGVVRRVVPEVSH